MLRKGLSHGRERRWDWMSIADIVDVCVEVVDEGDVGIVEKNVGIERDVGHLDEPR